MNALIGRNLTWRPGEWMQHNKYNIIHTRVCARTFPGVFAIHIMIAMQSARCTCVAVLIHTPHMMHIACTHHAHTLLMLDADVASLSAIPTQFFGEKVRVHRLCMCSSQTLHTIDAISMYTCCKCAHALHMQSCRLLASALAGAERACGPST